VGLRQTERENVELKLISNMTVITTPRRLRLLWSVGGDGEFPMWQMRKVILPALEHLRHVLRKGRSLMFREIIDILQLST
jgi:hypothetical protein